MVRVALLLLLAGCQQIFGLDDPSLVDATGATVNGSYKVMWLENGSNGIVRNERAYTTDEASASVRLDDGTERDVELRANGSFGFATAYEEQPYVLTLRNPYGALAIHHSATNLDILDRVAGHLDRKPVPTDGTVTLVIDNPAPPLALEMVQTTGLWMSGALTSASLDWNQLQSLSGPRGLLESSKHDGLYYAGYMDTGEYMQLMYWGGQRDVDVVPPTTLPIHVQNLFGTSCAELVLSLADEQKRIRRYAPASSASESQEWQVYGALHDELAWALSHPLAFGISTTPSNRTVLVNYANPLDLPVKASARVTASRVIDGVSLDVGSVSFTSVTQTTCGTGIPLPALDVAIPMNMHFAGSDLSADRTALTFSTDDPVATWDVSPGRVDYYVVQLFEVVGSQLVSRYSAVTGAMSFAVPRDLLLTGHTYVLSVLVSAGIPGAKTGDFRTVTMPLATGYAMSGFITVQ